MAWIISTGFIYENMTTLLLCSATILLFYRWSWRPRGIPPGPRATLPILGDLLSLGSNPLVAFKKFRQKYGDIFSLYMGNRLVIVINGYETMKEVFVKNGDVFSERPNLLIMDLLGGLGIVGSSGEMWRVRRKFTLATLREFGFGRTIMEDKIQTEIGIFLKRIEEEKEKAFDAKVMIQTSISNIICAIVFGKRFEYEDEYFMKYLRLLDENVEAAGGAAGVNFIPALKYIPGDPFHFYRIVRNHEIANKEFYEVQINEHEANFDETDSSDFINVYLKEMKDLEKAGKENTALTKENLVRTVGDFFIAGTETTAQTLRWALLFFLRHPEVQEKCFAEINNVVGCSRMPQTSDRPNLPYVEATVMELQRRSNIIPMSVWHGVLHEVTFRGYTFPKDVIVIPNLDSVLMDETIWKDPENFRPERFLDEQGHLIRPEELIPFSIGRRVCIGEVLAKMEIFLFVSAMIQKFQFSTEEGVDPPSAEGKLGVTLYSAPFKVLAIPRT